MEGKMQEKGKKSKEKEMKRKLNKNVKKIKK